MTSKATFYGGSKVVTLLAFNYDIPIQYRRLFVVLATDVADRVLTLPDARLCRKGGPIWCFINKSANRIVVDYNSGALCCYLTASQARLLFCQDNTTQDGTWRVQYYPV